MLGDQIENSKCKVHHASGDADLLIVQKAVASAAMVNTVLVGDDTDLLILLCYHASLDSHSILFRPEPKKTTKNPRLWDIKAVKKQLGPEVCSHILFLHAVLGCDTTSRLYGIGKGTSLKSSSQVYTSAHKPKHSMYSQLPPKMSLLRGNKCWSAFTMGDLGKTLTHYAISDSVRSWLPIPAMFGLRL